MNSGGKIGYTHTHVCPEGMHNWGHWNNCEPLLYHKFCPDHDGLPNNEAPRQDGK